MDRPATMPNAETAKLVKAVLAAGDHLRIPLRHFEEEFLKCTGESFPWQHLNYASVPECLESMDQICAIEKLTVINKSGRVVEDLFVTLREEKSVLNDVKSGVVPTPVSSIVASVASTVTLAASTVSTQPAMTQDIAAVSAPPSRHGGINDASKVIVTSAPVTTSVVHPDGTTNASTTRNAMNYMNEHRSAPALTFSINDNPHLHSL